MQFENSFSVRAPIDRVWTYMLDVEAVAPCVPGAQLTETVGENEYRGTVKVKLGAVQVNYKGALQLKEVDDRGHRVVLTASGSETRGTGGASGTVTSTLTQEADGLTTVHMVSEIQVTGRVAQFGRNIMQDVSNRLIREFANCLEANLNAQAPSSSPGATEDGNGAGRRAPTAGGEESASKPASPEPVAAAHETPGVETVSLSASPGHHPARPVSTPPMGAGGYGSHELKLMPLVVEIGRARLARALRRLAGIVDPEK